MGSVVFAVLDRLAKLRRLPPRDNRGLFSPANDLSPGNGRAVHTIVVATTPRSGSNMLTHTLRGAGFGGGQEYWNGRVLMEARQRWGVPDLTLRGYLGVLAAILRGRPLWWGSRRIKPDSFRDYLRLVERHLTSSSGVLQVKLFHAEMAILLRRIGADPADVLPGELHWVFLRRGDAVGQAISYETAMRTDQWVDQGGSDVELADMPVVYGDITPEIIRQRIEMFDQQNAKWEDYFAMRGIEPMRITYEQLVSDFRGTLAAIVAPVGGSIDDSVQPATRKQSTSESDRLRAMYLAAQGAST